MAATLSHPSDAPPPSPSLSHDEAVAELCAPSWPTTSSTRAELVIRSLLPASRRAEGRSELGARPRAIAHIAHLLNNHDNNNAAAPRSLLAQRAVRLLRNLCARSPTNQDRVRATRVHTHLINALRTDALGTPFYGFVVEFLVNFVTGNDSNAREVWSLMVTNHSHPVSVLATVVAGDNRVAAVAATALAHNCVAAVPAFLPDVVATRGPAPNTSAMQGDTSSSVDYSSLLHTVLSVIARERAANDDDDDGGDDEQFSWAYLLVKRLIAHGLFKDAFNALGPPVIDNSVDADANAKHGAQFSPLQRTFLHLLDASAGRAAGRSNAADEFSFPNGSAPFLADVLEAAFFDQDGTSIRVSASLVASVVLLASDDVDDLRLRAVKLAIAVLNSAPTDVNDIGNGNGGDDQRAKQDISKQWYDVKASLIRCVAICCDEFKKAQDAVRNVKGIPAILNCLAYDAGLDHRNNTYMREWAILAVRNLTLGNADNVAEINALEFKGLKQEDWLEKAGLEAFVDSATGKPKIRQKRQPPPAAATQ